MDKYDDTISFWNTIFSNGKLKEYTKETRIHEDLEYAIDWILREANNVLDYGCGSGAMLFRCAFHDNINKCTGIDISREAIQLGNETAKFNNLDNTMEFLCGGIDELRNIKDNFFDSVILSNIIDNITPEDAELVVQNISRILKIKGKVLLKVNPYLSQEKLDKEGAKLIHNNFYVERDGIYFWNLDTSEWRRFLEKYFEISEYKEIYFEEFNQYNRLFLLTNNKNS